MENREEYDELHILDYIDILKKHKWLITIIVSISVFATAVISFNLPNIYQATSAIIPASQAEEQYGMNTIAAQFGISSAPTANVSEIVRLLKSNILMEKVIKKHNLLPVFFKKEELKKIPDASKIWEGIRYLQDIFAATRNQKEGIIEIAAEFRDPEIASDIIDYMLAELTDYMSSEAKRVARTNRKYLESLINENSDPLIGQKIYHLIAKQIETAMMAEVKENFAFKILDPPKAPDKKIRPKIMKNIVISFITSLLASIFIAFFVEYIGKIKTRERK